MPSFGSYWPAGPVSNNNYLGAATKTNLSPLSGGLRGAANRQLFGLVWLFVAPRKKRQQKPRRRNTKKMLKALQIAFAAESDGVEEGEGQKEGAVLAIIMMAKV